MASKRKSCPVCGSTDLYPTGRCKPCDRVKQTKYRIANAASLKASKLAYCATHRESERQRASAWRAANHERALANDVDYRKAHQEEAKAYKRIWAADHSEHVVAKVRAWRKANPDAHKIHGQNRRKRAKESGGKLSRDLVQKLFEMQRGLCACCGRPLENDFQLDHIMPLYLGGQHADANMQLLRKRCNAQKNRKHPVDFMRERGFQL